jgi:hypothetical protein
LLNVQGGYLFMGYREEVAAAVKAVDDAVASGRWDGIIQDSIAARNGRPLESSVCPSAVMSSGYVVAEEDIAEMGEAMDTLISQGVFGPPGPNALPLFVPPSAVMSSANPYTGDEGKAKDSAKAQMEANE